MKKYLSLLFIATLAAGCGSGGGSSSGASAGVGAKVAAVTTFTATPATVNAGGTITVSWTVDQAKVSSSGYAFKAELIDGAKNPAYDPADGTTAGQMMFTAGCYSVSSKVCNETGCGAGHEICQYHGTITCTYVSAPNSLVKGSWDCRLPDNSKFYNLGWDIYSSGSPIAVGSVPLGVSFSARGRFESGNPMNYDWQSTPVTIN